MYNLLKDQLLKDFADKGQKVKITHGFYKLEDFHEASANRIAIPLGKGILIVKRISCIGGAFNTAAFTAASTFFALESNGKNVDLSHIVEMTELNNNVMILESNFPSVHDTYLKINYDLTTFFAVTGIFKASLEYIRIEPEN
jgi:hypothetical protein